MATGTADVAILISQELAKLESRGGDTMPGSDVPAVIGIDPSANMLDVSTLPCVSIGYKHTSSRAVKLAD